MTCGLCQIELSWLGWVVEAESMAPVEEKKDVEMKAAAAARGNEGPREDWRLTQTTCFFACG